MGVSHASSFGQTQIRARGGVSSFLQSQEQPVVVVIVVVVAL